MADETAMDIYDPAPSQGADYIVKFKIRNGPMLRAMRMRGFRTVTALCEAAKLSPSTVHRYLALTLAPINSQGSWKPGALAIARTLHLPPDVLFPEQHLERALARSTGELEVDKEQIALLLVPPDDDVERRELIADAMRDVLASLTPRQERVLRMRHGFGGGEPMTLDQVGQKLGVNRERVRQIEAKAIRTIKQIPTLKKLAGLGIVEANNCIAEERERKRRRAEDEAAWEAQRERERAEYAETQAKRTAEYEARLAEDMTHGPWPETPLRLGHAIKRAPFVFLYEADWHLLVQEAKNDFEVDHIRADSMMRLKIRPEIEKLKIEK